ncbi:E3 ubiquitin-protein ligase TRIM71-like [Branchiostoma floridae]|uniref:E3 ubiquitin-protein ligase TRIM71-like n=1 Tax=Branchiostoma floridae TaxID=7739 RepID=A0A9J7HH83_BRAFL|nr:E3 ubiquitin-protein ligase TRIM71-like [Branchiostoma floridae]
MAMGIFEAVLDHRDHLRGIAINKGILVTEAEQGAVQVFRPDGSLVRTVRHPRAGGMTRPGDVTVDGEGNILVSDWYNNYVYVYDEFGKFLFQFGGKGSGEGQLKYPLGICTDSSGHILVADSGNKRVQIFTRQGEFVRTVSTGSEPACLAMGPEGQLVVSNGLSHTVTVFSGDDSTDEAKKDARERYDSRSDRRQDVFGINAPEQERQAAGIEGAPSGSIGDKEQGLVTFGGEETQPGEYWYPRGVVVSPSNEIFVTDHNNRRVQVHSTEGVYLRHFPTVVPGTGGNTIQPRDVCMDGNGTLWVVGEGGSADHVVQYSTDGTAMARFDLKKSHHFRGIAVNVRTSHVLITDADQGEVLVFRPDGSLVRTVRYSLAGEIKRPRYITVDGEGNILVSDYNSNSVYVYDESGKFPFQFGGLGSGEGQLNGPRGICTNRLGHIIVADSRNKRVQIFTRHGEYVRTDSTGFEPEYLAVGPEGQLVVTSRVDRTVTVFPNY